MPSNNAVWAIEGSIATLTFARPAARNALTWDMYDAIVDACERADAEAARVLVLRGAGGAFAAGTDIAQFRDLSGGDDGIAYERRLEAVLDRLERVTAVTVAAVDGPAAGAGCALALACDLRVCSTRALFGVPIARTLGNCLSAANVSRLVEAVGPARARELLLTGRLMDVDEVSRLGLVARVVAPGEFDAAVRDLVEDLTRRAPSTIAATKAIFRRLREHRRLPSDDDILARCYASEEFREGVAAFLEGRAPRWAQPEERR